MNVGTYTNSPAQYRHYNRKGLLVSATAAFLFALFLLLVLVESRLIAAPGPLLVLFLAVLLAVVALWPAFVSMRTHTNGIDLFNPLFYAAWFFFLPQFTIASLIIVFGGLVTSPALLLPDPWTPRAEAIVFAIIGSIGLSMGYYLPIGKRIGWALPNFKALNHSPGMARLAATLFLLLGLITQLGSFRMGSFGYQFNLETSTWGSTFAWLAQLTVVGEGMIWYSYFRTKRGWRLLALACIGFILLTVLISGARGMLFNSLLVVAGGYVYAQSDLRFRRLWKWGLVILLGLLVGMVFGTFFRLTKVASLGRTSGMSFGDVISILNYSLLSIKQLSASEVFGFAWQRLAERMDGVTSLGVIVSFADHLKDNEVALGIDNNIVRDLATTFIPRFLWPSKPPVGVSEQIGNLYFHTQYNSPAVTYMGDLYRNFGILGVAIGMLILGVVLRGLYVWLIEKQERSPFRVGLFLLLGGVVNYEGLYSTYFPSLVRASLVAVAAVLLAGVVSIFRHASLKRWDTT